MASELRVNTLKDASGNNSIGMSYVANGSAKVLSRLDTYTPSNSPSFNVSSSTDNGTGDMTLSFTNSFSGANEQFPSMFNATNNIVSNHSNRAIAATTAFPSGTIRVGLRNDAGTALDSYSGSITIHGDLA